MQKQKIYAVVVAGGEGKRMGGNIPKQFIKIGNIPIIIRTLLPFEKSKKIDNIVLVLPVKWGKTGKNLLKKYHIKKVKKIVSAGRTRQSSVYNGLTALKTENPDYVIIHDAVRPFVTAELIRASCNAVAKYEAISTAIGIHDTLFEKKKNVILDRNNLVRLQTPQTFKYTLILNAHMRARKRKRWDFPDDSSLLLHYGTKTTLIKGEKTNIKITDKQDLRLARSIAKGFQ